MDKYEFDKMIKKLEEILSELGKIHADMNFLMSRLDDAIYDFGIIP